MKSSSDSNEFLFSSDRLDRLSTLNPEELIKIIELYKDTYERAVKINKKQAQTIVVLQAQLGIEAQELLLLQEQLVIVRNEIFGRSSERRKKDLVEKEGQDAQKKPKKQRPSVRFPNAELVESRFEFETLPSCPSCEVQMSPMGQFEESEEVDMVPRRFFVRRILRQKCRCGNCHSSIVTAPGPNKLIEGGSYSLGFATEVAVQKYAHHVPVERQKVQMQAQGLQGIEARTLIDQTHHLADLLRPAYRAIAKEVKSAKIINADETPWKMLEGHPKKSWCLWGFCCSTAIYLQAKDSRSQDTPNQFLNQSDAQYLVVDGYTGYCPGSKNNQIKIANCWAHVRRKFIKAEEFDSRATQIIDWIGMLYSLDREAENLKEKLLIRNTKSRQIIEKINEWLMAQHALPKSAMGKALQYARNYWQGLIVFLEDPGIPLDNNLAERALRGPVLGRKNFYGNHSQQGAETSSILYTICESCKLNHVDPANNVQYAASEIYAGKSPLTPAAYRALSP